MRISSRTSGKPVFYTHLDVYKRQTIYSPKETLLVQTAKTLGKKAAGGLDMLILQAVAAQEVWRETKFEKSLIKSLLDGVKL